MTDELRRTQGPLPAAGVPQNDARRAEVGQSSAPPIEGRAIEEMFLELLKSEHGALVAYVLGSI